MGIGKAIALRLASEGANIVICARGIKELKKSAEEIKKVGVKVMWSKCDVRNSKDVRKLIDKTMKEFGRIDILVNNAGVGLYKSVLETTIDEWDEVLDTNLKGIFLCSKFVLPIMMRQKYGRIINISSGAGKYGYANMSVYCASKFGVIGFTESLAREVRNTGIKVYSVCPGGTNTRMYHSMFPGTDPNELLKPDDVAKVVSELCLPDCRKESGSSVNVF